jgi:hypothetical protein
MKHDDTNKMIVLVPAAHGRVRLVVLDMTRDSAREHSTAHDPIDLPYSPTPPDAA